MDRFGEWRVIEAGADEKPASEAAQKAAAPGATSGTTARGVNLRFAALLAAAVLAVTGVVIWIALPGGSAAIRISQQAPNLEPFAVASDSPSGALPTPAADILVDVEGAVVEPGMHRLSAGSRVGDAIAAAGGYSPQVDISAAAQLLNLAQRLEDGAKVTVPIRGVVVAPLPSMVAEAPTGSGLIDINTAGTAELESLPGIGPVTAAKIIDARQQAAFTTVDELLSRGVVGPSTFEQVRALVTVGQ